MSGQAASGTVCSSPPAPVGSDATATAADSVDQRHMQLACTGQCVAALKQSDIDIHTGVGQR